MFRILVVALISLFYLSAFGETCLYSFDTENSRVEGTGYKTSEKTAVKATFPGFKLNRNEKKKSIEELLKGLQVTVDLMTIDSGNGLRDRNLRETLFAGIMGDSVVQITVIEVTKKQIKADVKLNNKSQQVVFDYSVKDKKIAAQGKFDLVEYAMGQQIAALKKRCGSLHTGSDDKSVTWTEFALAVTAQLVKSCK